MKVNVFLNSLVDRIRFLLGRASPQESSAPLRYEERLAFRAAELRSLLAESGRESYEERLLWLVEHLQLYIARWVGFALMGQLTVEQTFGNDVFCILRSAQEVINEEVAKARGISFPMAEWEAFENSLDFIQAHPSKENVSYVQESFERFFERYR